LGNLDRVLLVAAEYYRGRVPTSSDTPAIPDQER
jgi:hypothetical protein